MSQISHAARGFVAVISILIVVAAVLAMRAERAEDHAAEVREASQKAATQVTESSKFLTEQVRKFVVTRDLDHLDAYWTEVDTTQTQAKAIQRLTDLGTPQAELQLIEEAIAKSDALILPETRAMRLVLEATGVPKERYPEAVAEWEFSGADQALSPQEKLQRARDLVFSAEYDAAEETIMAPLNEFQETMQERTGEALAAAQVARDRWVDVELGLTITLLVGAVAILALFNRQVSAVITSYTAALRGADERDLRVNLEPAGVHEMRELANTFNGRAHSIVEVIGTVRANAGSLAALSTQLSGVAESLGASAQTTSTDSATASEDAENVSRHVHTVAAGTEEMGLSIQEIAAAAQHASSVAAEAVHSAGSAGETVTKLSESSNLIGEVIKAITSIAEQTNLLALNATIEAARAGEAGKGFAVVASEVKELASQTAASTQDISNRVAGIQGDAKDTERALAAITEVIGRINETQATIASAVEEQTATTQEMARTVSEAATGATGIAEKVTRVASSSQATTEGADQARQSSQELAEMARSLTSLVSGYTV